MSVDRAPVRERCYLCNREGVRGFRIIEERPGWHPRMALCTGRKACYRRAQRLIPPEVRADQRRALEAMA